MDKIPKKVIVLDMQPIDPPVGGGRLRLLGLYHNLGDNLDTQYIGTYDWPGEKFRDHQLSDSLREVDIPLSDEHFAECRKWQERVGGKTIIDSTFSQLAHLSPQYIDYVRSEAMKADVVIFSHPWVYPIVKDVLKQDIQIIIYDSQNVEGYLRFTLLDDGEFGTKIVRNVVKSEFELCHISDIILACSFEDCELFNKLYDIPFQKIKIVPNGVFTERIRPYSDAEKKAIRQQLGLKGNKIAIFIGSNYPPNLEACQFIIHDLAPVLNEFTFIIAGGVGEGIDKNLLKGINNVKITGFLSDKEKILYLAASDLAINPMFSGSGTNIKMFDFMAAGLPILSTDKGSRGILIGLYDAIQICNEDNFAERLKLLSHDKQSLSKMAQFARQLAEEKYSWEKISHDLGILIDRNVDQLSKKKPYFSVIIPTYNRHDKLNDLMKSLCKQKCRDFEVVIVDQSEDMWSQPDFTCDLDLFYIHIETKGAVRARNLAAFYARGIVLAFIDDDCIPAPEWLYNAKILIDQGDNIGIEGLIKSDKLNDPAYRHVKNEGFEGIGFMTANLLLSSEVFNRINGFDELFDHPHFREDTDLAWRALEYGDIPFSNEVCVLHPPHPRTIERESLTERNKFFQKDALLLKKHPKKYMELFIKENHWKETEGFWDNFLIGAHKYNIDINNYEIVKFLPKNIPTNKEQIKSTQMKTMNRNVRIRDLCIFLANRLQSTQESLSTEIPVEILNHLSSALKITEEIKKTIGENTHGDYFECSLERYKHYFAISEAFTSKGSSILDIGNAPGHVGIGLHLLGMEVQGVNLNDLWLATYPSLEWPKVFNVISKDIEKESLPFEDNSFDAIYFTETLEHIVYKNPEEILPEFLRVLKPGGIFVLSTPNVCNISNIFSLMSGMNIFWQGNIFYGSLDRHNREYTPQEVLDLVIKTGFRQITMYGINCSSNWRREGAEFANDAIREFGDNHFLLRNTIILYAFK
jgi:glycosyltransferase involved in cell wall biosynthesis/2-polyprenyl-3-methyl-5-hydroxy-6-metoxy-1,4-benzoquinol methylase